MIENLKIGFLETYFHSILNVLFRFYIILVNKDFT